MTSKLRKEAGSRQRNAPVFERIASPRAVIHIATSSLGSPIGRCTVSCTNAFLKSLTLKVNSSCCGCRIVHITFINEKLAKLLNTLKELMRTYGPDNGKRIARRLQNIADATNLAELAKIPQTRIHELSGPRDEQISVDINHPYRFLLAIDHEKTPRNENRGLDWNRIKKVKVVSITDAR
jgi:toxin HigB-1